MCQDPELRHTPSGVATTSFRLAVDRDFKDKATDERQTDFINVVAWRQTAEFVSRFFTKGRMALVQGRIQVRTYTDKDSNKRTATEGVADSVYFGDARREGEGQNTLGGAGYGPQGEQGFTELPDDGELPF